MYDINGNGTIEVEEMIEIVEAIAKMKSGKDGGEDGMVDPRERARTIFKMIDADQDGMITDKEFIEGCLRDENITKILKISEI